MKNNFFLEKQKKLQKKKEVEEYLKMKISAE